MNTFIRVPYFYFLSLLFAVSPCVASDCSSVTDADLVSTLESRGCVIEADLLSDIDSKHVQGTYGQLRSLFFHDGKLVSEADYRATPRCNGTAFAELWVLTAELQFLIPASMRFRFDFVYQGGPSIVSKVTLPQTGTEVTIAVYAANGYGCYSKTVGDFRRSLNKLFDVRVIPVR